METVKLPDGLVVTIEDEAFIQIVAAVQARTGCAEPVAREAAWDVLDVLCMGTESTRTRPS